MKIQSYKLPEKRPKDNGKRKGIDDTLDFVEMLIHGKITTGNQRLTKKVKQ